ITGAKVAIFTYRGCTLEVRGETDVIYISRETPMIQYLNCHAALEQMREKAEEDDTLGPIAMVVGPTDVGKSTLCKIFLNYAARMNRRPLYCDIDVGQGGLSVPGMIASILVERPASLIEGFSQSAPLVYHHGHKSPSENNALYKMIIKKMAEVAITSREANKGLKTSGIIINTCGWVKGEGYRSLLHAAEEFQVDVIFVLDQERLYNELLRDVPGKVKVVLLPKSGGVVEISKTQRAELRDSRIREYFYGGRSPLYPFSFDVKWADIKLYKIGAPPLPASCLPIGMKPEDHLTKLVPVSPSPAILHHLISISFAESLEDDVLCTNIMGFICVTAVDPERQTVTVLSPQPRPLPSNNILLLSDIQFMDSH
uniref:Protein CLP1 homolog n=1 Tax=Megaselia scalaris TaxID=36166 RepID=T1GC14_MEGSC